MLTRIYGTAFLSQAGPRRAPRAPRAGPRPRPPQARTRARAVHVLRALARAARSGSPPGWRSGTRSPSCGGPRTRARGYQRGQDADPLRRRAVEAVRATGTSTASNMFFTEVEDRPMGLKPMNCPAHIQIYNDRAPLLPRPADPLLRGRPRAPQRAQRDAARAAARAPHHPGRRPHLLHRGAGRARRSSAACDFGFCLYGLFGFEPRLELSTRPEKRIGSDEMWDRAEAALGRRARRAGPRLRASTPATAPSTGRRSTCT